MTVDEIIAPLHKLLCNFLLQPYNDCWLIHLYGADGSEHITTVLGMDLEDAVNKAVNYLEPKEETP